MTHLRSAAAALLCLAIAVSARAVEPNTRLVSKARDYVESDKLSKDVCGMMHAGATYKGCKEVDFFKVTNNGREVPGAFGLTVRVYWAFSSDDNDHTDVDYFFDSDGRVMEMEPGQTTAIFAQPFLASGLLIEALKQGMLNSLKGKPEEKTLGPIIEQANAKKFTEIYVKLNQP